MITDFFKYRAIRCIVPCSLNVRNGSAAAGWVEKDKRNCAFSPLSAVAFVENFGGASKRDCIGLWTGEYPLNTALRRKQAMARATTWVKAARSVSGIVIGYLIFVLGAWVVQEEILGGVSYHDDLTTIVLAGVLTPLAAAIGAIVTVIVAGRRPWLHLIPMFTLIVVETAYLYAKGRVDGPLWFETAAGASLIVGGTIGALFWQLLLKQRWADHVSSP